MPHPLTVQKKVDSEVHGLIDDNLFIPIQDLKHSAIDTVLVDAGRAKDGITCREGGKIR